MAWFDGTLWTYRPDEPPPWHGRNRFTWSLAYALGLIAVELVVIIALVLLA